MSSTSPNKGYTIPAVGSDDSQWGTALNITLGLIDQNLGGNVAIAVTGGSVVLNSVQASNLAVVLTGTLTSDAQVKLPSGLGGEWVIDNRTSGAYGVTVLTTAVGSTGTICPQGAKTSVWSDGSNVAASQSTLYPGNNLSDLGNAATARTNLGLGTAATFAATSFLQGVNNLSDLNNAATARSNLGLGTAAVKNTGTSGATVPLCNTANTWGGQQTPLTGVLTDAATVAWDCSLAQVATLSTAASRTIGAPTNAVVNTGYRLVITTNGYSPSWNTVFKFDSGVAPSGLSGLCIFDFYYDGTNFNCTGQSVAEA